MDYDVWYIACIVLMFVIGFLATENYKLRKYKKLWVDQAKRAVQAQVDFTNQMQYGKPKVKDIN